MNRIRVLSREYWFELLVAALAIAGMLELVVGRESPGAPSTTLWFTVPAVGLLVLPLFLRKRFPFAAPASYWVLAAGLAFVDGLLIPFIGSLGLVGLATAFLLGHIRNPAKAVVGLFVLTVGIVVVIYEIPGDETTSQYVFISLRFVVAWVAGYVLRERAERAEAAEERAARAEQEREGAARVAVAEERARIARELHDIVAHSVSIMVLQVGAIRHKLPEMLAEDREALKGIERTGREALAEMRRLLGAMRQDGDGLELAPHPGVDRLDALLEEVGRAGLPVELHVAGDRFPLPRAIDLSAYRIVQEGLTNALKHAHASQADVTFNYAADELQIEVRDNGEGFSTTDGLGHGLVGIRERVKIYGGEMTAGAAPDGGFVLGARLPLEGYES